MLSHGSKKSDWLWADINGLIYTWGAIVLLMIFCGILNLLDDRLGKNSSFGLMMLLTGSLAFFLVFVLRLNFTVIGPRRKFRYFCSWI